MADGSSNGLKVDAATQRLLTETVGALLTSIDGADARDTAILTASRAGIYGPPIRPPSCR